MESRFQTSFIPKKPIEPVSSELTSERQPLGFFFALSIFIVILSVLAALGTFLYSKILDKQIIGLENSLKASEKEFDGTLVKQLGRIDDRINTAQTLLNNHIGFSTFFTLVSSTTLKTIQFTNFQYTNSGPNKIAISLKGIAKDYASVARQSEIFSDAQYTEGSIKSPLFSDLNLDQAGNVIFSISALLDPGLISYKKNLIGSEVPSQSTDIQNAAPDVVNNESQTNIVSNP